MKSASVVSLRAAGPLALAVLAINVLSALPAIWKVPSEARATQEPSFCALSKLSPGASEAFIAQTRSATSSVSSRPTHIALGDVHVFESRLCVAEMRGYQLARGIVDKYQQHAGLGSILEPTVIGAVDLDQFTDASTSNTRLLHFGRPHLARQQGAGSAPVTG
jgi:hypothetical protein